MNRKKLDIDFMKIALLLAKKGKFTVSPNPKVGCVVVKNNEIIGTGFHYQCGKPHAEVYALEMAGKKTVGSTIYTILEPCNHYGKTPPCTDLIIRSGVSRAVISILDPNFLVLGSGVRSLKQAGIEVVHGVLKSESEKLNKEFLKRMQTGLPYIKLKMASSLDGKTALYSGKSKWITSIYSRQDVQKLRAQSDVILTTGKTVISDNPSLNLRWRDFSQKLQQEYCRTDLRQPMRVIIDLSNKVNPSHMVTRVSGQCLLIRTCLETQRWFGRVEQWIMKGKENFSLLSLFSRLAEIGANSILIECGETFSSFLLKRNLIDELILYIAPKILGSQAKGLFAISKLTSLKYAPNFDIIHIKRIGSDIRLILRPHYLRVRESYKNKEL